jgi:hypothetical protein
MEPTPRASSGATADEQDNGGKTNVNRPERNLNAPWPAIFRG